MVKSMCAAAILSIAAATAATGVAAQAVTAQSEVLGPSGNSVFSQQVRGTDGVVYDCRPDIVVRNGVPTRICRRIGALGTTGGLPSTVGGGLLALGLIGVLAGGSSDSASSTN